MRRRSMAALVLAAGLVVAGCTPDRPPLTFDPATLPAAHVGVAYDARITIGQNATPVGAFSISAGALPAGLAIESVPDTDNLGHIHGTPTSAGTASFSIYVWCRGTTVGGQEATRQYSLEVTP